MRALGSQYLLDVPIGRGGFGQVWRARDHDGQLFAVKILRPDLSDDPAIVARFVRERGMVVGIRNPHLVQVRDFVVEGDTLAIVMDLVDGPDLQTELRRRGTLPPAEALRIVSGVCRGLAAVHARGIVHRDIKPSNILLEPAGSGSTPKITDFGVGWLFDEAHVTSTSGVVGTPEYMAPEYAEDGVAASGVDLYAVGIMLYQLVCGVTPFAGGNPMAVLKRHVGHLPGRPPGIRPAVWDMIEQLMAKDPKQRPTAALAATALAQLAQEVVDEPAAAPLAAPPASLPMPADPTAVPAPVAPAAGDTTHQAVRVTGGVHLVGQPPAEHANDPEPPQQPDSDGRRRHRRAALVAAIGVVVLLLGSGTVIALMTRNADDVGTASASQPTDQASTAADGPSASTSSPATHSTAAAASSPTPVSSLSVSPASAESSAPAADGALAAAAPTDGGAGIAAEPAAVEPQVAVAPQVPQADPPDAPRQDPIVEQSPVIQRSIPPPSILTASLPDGTVGRSYSAPLQATGVDPLNWGVVSGNALGMTLSPSGVLSSGPLTGTGTGVFTVKVTDGTGLAATRNLSITVVRLDGDVNSDGLVDCGDVGIVKANFGQPGGLAQGDVNGDGTVNVFDLSQLLSHWTGAPSNC